jgi:hypothetical protein
MKKTWSSIIIYCEKIRQKLYHVVNKSVWADIGDTSKSSTNILVLLVLSLPIGEDTQTFYNYKNFADFLKCLQHQYIGAVQGESKCFQHHAYSVKHCLFNQLE